MTLNLFNNCYNLNHDFVSQTKIFGNANLPVCLTAYLPLLVNNAIERGLYLHRHLPKGTSGLKK